MAKIVLSKDAPKGQRLCGAFGPSTFDAGTKKSFHTDDPILIEGADQYPFFDVVLDVVDDEVDVPDEDVVEPDPADVDVAEDKQEDVS